MTNILVVGAGFSGSVIARECAQAGHNITIIDKRNHIGGNCFDFLDKNNILIHLYGPHLFHTSDIEVVEWLSKFTKWTPYKHKVKAKLSNGQLVTLPVNKNTVQVVGRENIIDTFYRPYTKKMWNMDIEELDPSILNRVPVRDDDNEFYFPNDDFQAMPALGYTHLFENILNHRNISVKLNTTFSDDLMDKFDFIFNSMPIDEYFKYSLGRLPYRSIKFHTYTLQIPNIFPTATVNFTHDGPCTRVTEWKNIPNCDAFNPSKYATTLTVEEPCADYENNNEPFYPVKDINGINRQKYEQYASMIPRNMCFIGRCGTYSYFDMDKAIRAALDISFSFLSK